MEWSCREAASHQGGLRVPRYPLQRRPDPSRPTPAGAADRRSATGRSLVPPSGTTCPGRRRRSGPTGTARRARAAWSTAPRDPHHQPHRTPAPVVRKIVHLRWKQRLGPGRRSRDRLGMPASTVHAVLVRCRINRLTHLDRATGEPIRRYEHDTPRGPDPRRRQEARQRPRRRRLALRRAPAGREEPGRNLGTDRGQEQVPATADRDLLPAHRDRRPLPRRLRRGPRRRDQGDRRRGPAQRGRLVRRTRRHRAAGPVRQRQLLPQPPLARHLHRAGHHPEDGPGPTDHRPTARSNASTAPWPRAGRSRSSTTPRPPDSPLCQHGSTSTTTTGPTQQSARPHPSPDWTTWLDITTSRRGFRHRRRGCGRPRRTRDPMPASQPARLRRRPVPRTSRDAESRSSIGIAP